MDPLELLKRTLELKIFDYLRDVLPGLLGWNSNTIEILLDTIGVLTVSTFCLLIVLFLIWLERKVIARMQDRVGPNRVGGRYGLLQTVADVMKLLSKEDVTPYGADKLIYNVAPILIVITALLLWAVLPFAPGLIGVDLNIGLFYILSLSSASVVALLLAGWGSNNKYALLGAFRAVAQLISYEVPMILALIVPILLAQSMSMTAIIDAQAVPFILVVPVSALIFFVAAVAETGRTPFDLLEAESEIVAGFHVEYGGMKFGMFFLAEFISTLFMSGLFAVVYLGGWRFFGIENLTIADVQIGNLLALVVFFVKMFAVYFMFIWLRGTLPRFRIDQMMDLNWKGFVPLSALALVVAALVDQLLPAGINEYAAAGWHLFSNILLGWLALELLRRRAHRQRQDLAARVAVIETRAQAQAGQAVSGAH